MAEFKPEQPYTSPNTYLADTNQPINDPRARRRWNRAKVIALIVIVSVLTIALAVGLGVGLGLKKVPGGSGSSTGSQGGSSSGTGSPGGSSGTGSSGGGSSGNTGSTCHPPGGQQCETSGDCELDFSKCIMACNGFSYCT